MFGHHNPVTLCKPLRKKRASKVKTNVKETSIIAKFKRMGQQLGAVLLHQLVE